MEVEVVLFCNVEEVVQLVNTGHKAALIFQMNKNIFYAVVLGTKLAFVDESCMFFLLLFI